MKLSDIKKEDYCVHSTFPEVDKNIPKEEKVARKLLDIYAGSKGEFTATCQYIYESFIVKPENKELSEILENISICEMEHQEIISQILLSMGINPKFCKYIDSNQNICNYWSAANIKYITDISKFIDYNIKLEEYAVNDYNELLRLTDNDNIKEIINEILKDEKAHILIFNNIKNILKSNDTSRNNTVENVLNKTNSTIELSNNDSEIVSIFSTSPNNKVDINKKIISTNNTKNVNINETVLLPSPLNNSIQIPISDLNNFIEIDDG